MAGINSNRTLSLAGVVSVEAWYDRFSEENVESDFYCHIKFQDGVFGASPETPVTFKIRLRNASISIVPEEPIKIPRQSVRRDRIEVEARRTIETTNDSSRSLEAEGNLELSSKKVSGAGKAAAKGQLAAGRSESSSRSIVSHSGMTIEHSTDDQGFNKWSFAPVQGPHLLGQAFNQTEALLKLRHQGDPTKIPPVVKVQVNCLREDIDILELKVKDENKKFLSRGMGEHQKLKLAEEMIKSALLEGGLSFEGDLDGVSVVQVADVIAAEE